jgi:hypothetical protein
LGVGASFGLSSAFAVVSLSTIIKITTTAIIVTTTTTTTIIITTTSSVPLPKHPKHLFNTHTVGATQHGCAWRKRRCPAALTLEVEFEAVAAVTTATSVLVVLVLVLLVVLH